MKSLHHRPVRLLWGFVAIAGLAQSLSGASGALLAEEVTGTPLLAGAPQTMLTLGAAGSALPLAAVATRAGRAAALALGCLVGAVGCAIVVAAATQGSAAGILAGSGLLGAGNTSVMLARYAGAELRPDLARGQAFAAILFATTVGAVLGPNLLAASTQLTAVLGDDLLPKLSGAYVVSGAVYLLAAAIVLVLRPVLPAARVSDVAHHTVRRGTNRTFNSGIVTLSISNLVMVGVMTLAPVHMHHHGSGLGTIGLVVSAHIAGMFAPAPLSGWLTHRLGARRAGMSAAAVLVVACLAAALVADGPLFGLAMVLLGIGWNLALVSGSVLLTHGLPLVDRPRHESLGEIGAGMAAVVGGIGAGVLSGLAGYPALALAGAVASLVLAILLSRERGTRPTRLTPGLQAFDPVSTPEATARSRRRGPSKRSASQSRSSMLGRPFRRGTRDVTFAGRRGSPQ